MFDTEHEYPASHIVWQLANEVVDMAHSQRTAVGDSYHSRSDALLDQIDAAVYTVDANGLGLRINLAGERLLGYSQGEISGKDMHDLIHNHWPDGTPYHVADCPLLRARSTRVKATGLEEVLWAKDGSAVLVECSSAPLPLESGSFGAVITLKDLRARASAEKRLQDAVRQQEETIRQRDATARLASELAAEQSKRQHEMHASVERAAMAKIQEQQELLGTVAETAPIGIAVFDRDMLYRWVNESYQQSMDPAFQNISLSGTSFFDTVAAEHLDELRTIVDEVQRTGVAFTSPAYALTGVHRSMTYWRWSLTQLGNGDLMSTSADVTEQVNARREIEAVYADAPIALSLIDAKTLHYLRANLKYADMMGVQREQLIGKRVGTFSSSADTESVLQQAAAGQFIYNRLLHLNILGSSAESERFLLVNATPNRNVSGTVETISLALTDVTAQKRAEDALVQADKLAAVGRLAASISHEINNPLEAVTNLLYLVHQDQALSDESCMYIQQAEEELARVSQIASQTLRFQRHAVNAVPVTARQLIDPVVALYQGRLKHTHIQVTVKYSGEQQDMVVFEGDVRQILNNLLGNAIDAMPAGGGTITLRAKTARCMHTRRRGTRISVADTGQGMTAQTAAHIFEPFYTTKGASGSGLGLWISHTLAHRHGGALRVRSCKASSHPTGKSGTVFSLFLPNLEIERKKA